MTFLNKTWRKISSSKPVGMVRKNLSYSKVKTFAVNHPFPAFFTSLLILLLLIIIGSTVLKPKAQEDHTQAVTKEVSVFSLGEAPKITVQGKVKKSGVIKIVAQTPGIISSVNIVEGEEVARGRVLVNIASNYQGGNVLSFSRQISQTQLNLAQETNSIQKDLINKQKDAANKLDENTDTLRNITDKSIGETRSLLDLNQSILAGLNGNLQSLESTNDGSPEDAAAILQAKQFVSQFQSSVNQLRSLLRTSEFQASSGNAPAKLSDLQKDITIRQLEIQEKSLDANLQISKLQYQLALVSEATMFPAAPANAVVQRVHVNYGQSVNPGTVLATLAVSDKDPIVIDALVPKKIANNVSRLEESTITANGKTLKATPYFVSTEATSGQLYSILFTIDDSQKDLFTNEQSVLVELSIGVADTNNITPFIPVDSVFQTQEKSYVFVMENGKAKTRTVELGNVEGSFVEVASGLGGNDKVILDRNVIDQDSVKEKTS